MADAFPVRGRQRAVARVGALAEGGVEIEGGGCGGEVRVGDAGDGFGGGVVVEGEGTRGGVEVGKPGSEVVPVGLEGGGGEAEVGLLEGCGAAVGHYEDVVGGVVVVDVGDGDVGVGEVGGEEGEGEVLEGHAGHGEGDVRLGGDVGFGVFEDPGRVGGGGEAVDEVGGAAGEGR